MTTERVDLVALGQMVKNPHAYPIVMLTQGLEYCIAELENLRTTTAEDALYIKLLEEDMEDYE